MPESIDHINFIHTKEISEKTGVQKLFDWTLTSGRKIIVITEIIVLLCLSLRFIATREINALKHNVEEKKVQIESINNFENEFIKYQKKAYLAEQLLNNRTDWSEKTKEFNNNIPQSVILENISYEKEMVILSANVNSAEAFAILISKLRADQNVHEVILKASKYDTEKEMYKFSLEINYL